MNHQNELLRLSRLKLDARDSAKLIYCNEHLKHAPGNLNIHGIVEEISEKILKEMKLGKVFEKLDTKTWKLSEENKKNSPP